MHRIMSKIKEEIINAIPAIIFFLIAFNYIFFAEGLMLKFDDQPYFSFLTVSIGALLIGKVLIIVNSFPFINLFPNRPIIYNIVWKSLIYNFFVILFKLLETAIRTYYKYGDSSYILPHIKKGLTSPVFWSVEMFLFMTFIVYVISEEFISKLGKKQILKILFG